MIFRYFVMLFANRFALCIYVTDFIRYKQQFIFGKKLK